MGLRCVLEAARGLEFRTSLCGQITHHGLMAASDGDADAKNGRSRRVPPALTWPHDGSGADRNYVGNHGDFYAVSLAAVRGRIARLHAAAGNYAKGLSLIS